MKKLILMVLLVCIMVAPALAETTGGADFPNKYVRGARVWNHDHNYADTNTHADLNVPDARNMEYGAGLDLVVYENGPFALTAESKFDFGNMEYNGYAVVSVNVWEMFTRSE